MKATLQKRIGENNILLSQRKASLDAVKKSLEGSQQQLLLLNASLAGVKQQVAIMNSESDNALLMTNDALRKSILSDVGKEIISQKENITSQFGKLGDLAKTVTFAPIMAPALLGNTEKLILEFLGVSNI